MRGAFADGARTHLLAVPDALEPDVRAATEEIFEDFTLIDPVMDPHGLVASYLDSIAEPLGRLRELGMQLVAVKTSGSLEVAGNATPWTQTELLVAPSPCWFRRDGDRSAPVHVLGARCDEGHRVFAENGVGVQLFRSRVAVEQALEQAVLWCPTCVMVDVEIA